MKYVLAFGISALYCLAAAVWLGGWAWLLLWPALSFALTAVGYAGLGPGVFGKGPGGRHHPALRILHLPFQLVLQLVWRIANWPERHAWCHEIAPGLWLGRRPLARHLAHLPADALTVVDLTCEFRRAPGLGCADFVCLPTLDATAPDPDGFRRLIERLDPSPQAPVYVHCAAGRGRSSMVVGALLLRMGLVDDLDEALAHIRRIRPQVGWNRRQRAFLEEVLGRGAGEG